MMGPPSILARPPCIADLWVICYLGCTGPDGRLPSVDAAPVLAATISVPAAPYCGFAGGRGLGCGSPT